MDVRFSNHTLFNCALVNISEENDVIELMESRLNQSVKLLQSVLNFIVEEANKNNRVNVVEAIITKYKRIIVFNKKLKPLTEKYWNVDELSILIIMLRTITRKKYSAMETTVKKFIIKGKIPSSKVISSNQEWLLKAYKCLGVLSHTNWSNNIDINLVQITCGKKITVQETISNVQEAEFHIKQSGILDAELDSVTAQILSKCAYPELIVKNKEGLTIQLIDVISEMIFTLEGIKDSNSQEIALNETIKQIEKTTLDIKYNYDKSKYYKDEYWDGVMNDKEYEEDINYIKRLITEKYAVEIDTLNKTSL